MRTGDMVMLVFACCPKGRKWIGWTGVVEGMYDVSFGVSRCFCGHETRGLHAWVDMDGKGIVPVSWLIKVDPPKEKVVREDELEAT